MVYLISLKRLFLNSVIKKIDWTLIVKHN